MSVWKLFVTDRRALNLRATASPLTAIGPQRTLAKPLDL